MILAVQFGLSVFIYSAIMNFSYMNPSRLTGCRAASATALALLLSMFSGGAFAAESAETIVAKPAWDFRMAARLQLDRGYFYNDKGTEFDHGDNVRRARLGFRVRYGDHWSLSHTYDFARDGLEGIRDTVLQYRDGQGMRYTIGHFKEPFSMERLTSVRDLTFMERSLASTLAPPRARGVEVHHHTAHGTTAVGVFKGGFEDSVLNTEYGVSGRKTFAPRSAAGDILHFGGSVAYRKTDSSNEVRFRQRLETRNSDERLVDTGSFLASDFTYFGAEAAYAKGPFAIQSEYIHALIRNARMAEGDPRNSVNFNGWHVDFSWILTGEDQPYHLEKGTFDRIKPRNGLGNGQGGFGAVRAAIRWSGLNLSDEFVRGGAQQNLGASVTWYANDYVTLMAEYIRVIKLSGDYRNASPYVYQARLQLSF